MQIYNDPAGGSQSSIGDEQFNEFFYQKAALIEAKKETYFGQMADTISMPKNMGKKIKRYHYLPLLDDANINDQGLDVNGVTLAWSYTIIVYLPGAQAATSGANAKYFVGEDDDPTPATAQAAAKTAAEAEAYAWFIAQGVTDGTTYAPTAVNAVAAGYIVEDDVQGAAAAAAVPATGNLYGSSKDIGAIVGKMPTLTENGGQVNRVGFRRRELEGSLEKYGFYDEYTQESLDFDSDPELDMHINREMVRGANEITEDLIQIDILSSAGMIRFGGAAAATVEVTGLGTTAAGTLSVMSYEGLLRMSIDLDNNRCPKNTKLISGTRMVDTRTIYGARYIYVGSELLPSIHRMVDLHGNAAFIPTQQYASAGNIATGEVGSVGMFRVIVVPEMMHWAGVGAVVGANDGEDGPYRSADTGSGERYNVYPAIVVGSGSFTTIGFQTSGKTVKFKIKHAKPGSTESYANDPYGETGFMSIKWYYGFMLLRPEHIALYKVVAEL